VGTVAVRDLATGEVLVEMQGLCSWDESRLLSDPSLTPEETGAGCRPFPETPFPMWTFWIRWSPDGQWLMANDAERQFVVIWRADTGELEATIPPGEGDSRMLFPYFTPDGSRLLVPWIGTRDGEERNGVDVYSTGTWQSESSVTIEGHLEPGVVPVGVAPDGSVMYALAGYARFGGTVELVWLDARTFQPVGPPIDSLHDGQIKASALSPDRLRLATGSADGVLRVWDLASRRLAHEVNLRDVYPGQQVQGLSWADDRHLAAILQDGHLTVLTTDLDELLVFAEQSLTRGFTSSECGRFQIQPCAAAAPP
jgi:WD40 repeat protein